MLLANSCSVESINAITSIVKSRGPIRNGDHLFREGQGARSIYIVQNGTVKCERVSSNGGVHVAGFFLSGDILGCEDIGGGTHCYDAIALEESRVCEIPVDQLERLFSVYPDLQHCFLSRISERIRSSERSLTDSFCLRAKHRLIGFLCDFYTRLSQRKREMGSSIVLPMNKLDIANHLGISPETLSRLLRELEDERQIRNGLRQIELIDPENLARYCNP